MPANEYDTMMNDDKLINELMTCRDYEGYNEIDNIFISYGFGNSSVEDKIKVLCSIMGIISTFSSQGLSNENKYNLVKDIFSSRVWEEFSK